MGSPPPSFSPRNRAMAAPLFFPFCVSRRRHDSVSFSPPPGLALPPSFSPPRAVSNPKYYACVFFFSSLGPPKTTFSPPPSTSIQKLRFQSMTGSPFPFVLPRGLFFFLSFAPPGWRFALGNMRRSAFSHSFPPLSPARGA